MALGDLRLSQNMKYTALYWALRFLETDENIFEKQYLVGIKLKIDVNKQILYCEEKELFKLDTHESFVALECLDRLLLLGYYFDEFEIYQDHFFFKNFHVHFIVWDETFPKVIKNNECFYKSRLMSGVVEYKSKFAFNGELYDYGLFEEKNDEQHFKKKQIIDFQNDDFIFDETTAIKYLGHDRKVIVPEGVESLEPALFWDNQTIEEVVLPNSLKNMGGDTFYNCQNLKKVNIPKNVNFIGNNPFAGCLNVQIRNESKMFIYENGILYSRDKEQLIYCSIHESETKLRIEEGIKIIGKHAFYLCDRFEEIVLPRSLLKMENNPFSGCTKLNLICLSDAYHVENDIIYNRYKTSIVGALRKIKSDNLIIPEGVKTINRNSFWNCEGISKIVFPSSLEDIGYNPFVACKNIHFESRSSKFKVIDDVLYNEDCSKIICYPNWKAVGEVHLRDSVTTLERGAFSGSSLMTAINLRNVSLINKSCFTNCSNLKGVYCSDLITYIGEWAFAYCSDLKSISIYKETIVDNNAFANCHLDIKIRDERSNYVIESENLYSLKSMQKAYKNKIDAILIDPPYNSHIDYIGYKDENYEEGYALFMKQRMQLAYSLLSKEGFLIINIDDGELENLINISKSIFGEENISVHKWKKKHPFFDANRVVLNPNKVQTDFENIIICKKGKENKFNKINQPYIEGGVLKESLSELPEVFDCFGTTSSAKDEIAQIFGERTYFSTPKPVKLMKELVRATTSKTSLVLDFFAGSGTLGQAVEELNQEDGGNRHYILISNNESNICQDVTIKRMEHINSKFVKLI